MKSQIKSIINGTYYQCPPPLPLKPSDAKYIPSQILYYVAIYLTLFLQYITIKQFIHCGKNYNKIDSFLKKSTSKNNTCANLTR